MERAALLVSTQITHHYVARGQDVSTSVPFIIQGIQRTQGVVQGLLGGGMWRGFINTSFNVTPKNFNKHSK